MNWKPIETAPKDGTSILVCCEIGFMYVAHWNGKLWLSDACADSYFGADDATHWMPLPAPPEPQNG